MNCFTIYFFIKFYSLFQKYYFFYLFLLDLFINLFLQTNKPRPFGLILSNKNLID